MIVFATIGIALASIALLAAVSLYGSPGVGTLVLLGAIGGYVLGVADGTQ